MEKINIHNYEAFLLDFIEGNLSAEKQQQLFVFLADNPELKAAFEGDFSEVILMPENAVFEKKELLKVEDDTLLSLTNVETWMIASVEQQLDAKKQKELELFIYQNNLQPIYKTYQATLLKADLNEVFEDKNRLKVATGIILPLYARIAAVAAIGIVLIAVALQALNPNTTLPPQDLAGAISSDLNKNHLAAFINPLNTDFIGEDSTSNNTILNSNSPENYKPNKEKKLSGIDLIVEKNPEKNNKETTENKTKILDDNFEEFVTNGENKNDDDTSLVISNENDVAQVPVIKTEQPYKLITDAASNITNRDISFSRQINTQSNEYIAYQFKLGNFEFERKKNK